MRLDISIEHYRGAMIVRLKGELDHHSATDLKNRMEMMIEQEDINHIILSLRELNFMDSSGLGVILGRYKRVLNKGGKMIVCDCSPSIYRLFEMSGLFKIIAIEENEQHALDRLGVVS